MYFKELRPQIKKDSGILRVHTAQLAVQFAKALHQWTEQQQATPTILVPLTKLEQLYRELKMCSKIGLLALDILKLIDKLVEDTAVSTHASDLTSEPLS